MAEQYLEKSETKTCEACGARFSCRAKSGQCWCFEIDLSAETLAKLGENFKSCLCPGCLLNDKFSQIQSKFSDTE